MAVAEIRQHACASAGKVKSGAEAAARQIAACIVHQPQALSAFTQLMPDSLPELVI